MTEETEVRQHQHKFGPNPMLVLPYKYPQYLKTYSEHSRPGKIVVNRNDQFFFPLVRDSGTYNEDEVNLMWACIDAEDTVVEIGANAGYHTLPLAEIADEVIAFEPQRLIHQQLCGNLAINGVFNVSALNAAVSDQSGLIRMPSTDPYTAGQNSGGMTVRNDQENGDTVPMITLDSMGLPSFKFAKIDVEGHEPQVLAGMSNCIDKYRPILYVEFDRNQDAITEILSAKGYNLWHTQPRHGRFYPVEHEWHMLIAEMLIAIPSERWGDISVEARDVLGEATMLGYQLVDTPFGGIRKFRAGEELNRG